MENQEHPSVRGDTLETALVHYTVHDRTNGRAPSSSSYENFAEAVDAYQPNAELYLVIGKRMIEMDVGRDMFGFHRDLLKLLEHIILNLPNYGLYHDSLGPIEAGSTLYSLVLTDFHEPPVLYFAVVRDVVLVQTRTLLKGQAIATDDDVTDFVTYDKLDFLYNCCSFLRRYTKDLGDQLPAARKFDEYASSLRMLDLLPARNEG